MNMLVTVLMLALLSPAGETIVQADDPADIPFSMIRHAFSMPLELARAVLPGQTPEARLHRASSSLPKWKQMHSLEFERTSRTS